MGPKVTHKHRTSSQKSSSPGRASAALTPDHLLESIRKCGAGKRLKCDVWWGEITFSRTQPAGKEDMMKREEGYGGRGRGMGQQKTVETSFFYKLAFTAAAMPEYCLKHL